MELFDLEIHQKISKLDYQRLKTMVNRSMDQKLRLRNFDARNERIETGQWLRIAGVNVVLKEDQKNALNHRQKNMVEKKEPQRQKPVREDQSTAVQRLLERYYSVKFNYVFQPCNDTFRFGEIVPTSYDEYTALVKSGNVASKHVNGWRVRLKRQI